MISNYKVVPRCGEWGLYHINQQLSELLACILLDDEVMFLVILERKVDMNWFLWGMGELGFRE